MWQMISPISLAANVTVGTYEFPWQTIGSQNFRAWQIDRVKFRDRHGAFVALGTYAMKDDSAKTTVRLHGSGGSYSECVAALEARYDRNKLVYRHHAKKLFYLEAVSESYDGLIKLKEDLTRHVGGLRACKGDTFEQLVVAVLEPLLPTLSARLWSEFTTSSTHPPSLSEFVKFLDQRLQAVETVMDSKPPVSKKSTPRPFHKDQNREKPRALHLRDSDSCPCCDGRHLLYFCQAFKNLSVDKRNTVVRKNRICINCLSRGHTMSDCSSKHSCRECGKRHHSLLHKSGHNSNSQPPPHDSTTSAGTTPPTVTQPPGDTSKSMYQQHSMTDSVQPPAYIPATALATVQADGCQRKARVLMDSGSGITLITSRLANSLKVRKKPTIQHITGLSGIKCFTSKHVVTCVLKSATQSGGEEVKVVAHVVDKITSDYALQDLSNVRSLPFLKGKPLADPEFGKSGHVDMLLSMADSNRCTYDHSESTPDRSFRAWSSIFGWVIGGQTDSAESVPLCMKIVAADSRADEILQRFWKQEEVPGEDSTLTASDQRALDLFQDTTRRDCQGRYVVTLPRREPPLTLGESRQQVLRRYNQNKTSLLKKGKWESFHAGLDEYRIMNHAEIVPTSEVKSPPGEVFYLPTHGVVKESSSTTKLRIVFDGSARTSNGHSLNDILLPGPSLYPLLSKVITQFRLHAVGMTSDISKMFREISLAEGDKDLHRFLHEDSDGQLRDWRMKRVTFGITSSPFLASKVLLQVAAEYADQFPHASEVVRNSFYVDDCLTGAPTVEEASQLRADLNSLLSLGCLTLRKWRSNSTELLASIPAELRETDNSELDISPSDCPKTLGLHWNSKSDTLHVCTPPLIESDPPTKREVASAVGKTFDVMGWYAPCTILIKILLQQLWKTKLGWDETLPPSLLPTWERWKEELPMLTTNPIPRRYTAKNSPPVSVQLHGFSDASQAAFGGVVYLRILHQDASVTVSLVTAKTRVAPLPGSTIPRLELCGALLLAKLLSQTAKDLHINSIQIFAWCDSTAVLGWLNMSPTRLKVYVANRVMELVKLIPPEQWRYVATQLNPADIASRGLSPKQLLASTLWWQGPEWLALSPEHWPKRPDINGSRELPELRSTVLLIKSPLPEMDLWKRYSSLQPLVITTAWCHRFILNCHGTQIVKEIRLTSSELETARLLLFKLSQQLTYPDELLQLSQGKPISSQSSIMSLSPLIGSDGLLRVGGRLTHSLLSRSIKHPIIIHKCSLLSKLLVWQVHLDSGHAGVGTMLAILSENYHIIGVRSLLRQVSRTCITCQKTYARAAGQLMGQLPLERVTPAPPFTHVGIDFAGPFYVKRGHTRKYTKLKVYVCLFLCFSTKSTHLELVSDLTTDAFIAALTRFVSRRGSPTTIWTDNGTNFVGASRELKDLYNLLQSKQTQDSVHHFAASRSITWNFSPSRSPHFGGLWETGVKQMKILCRKIIGTQTLTYEELHTVLAEVEATLNSRPLIPEHSTSPDGTELVTAGHFLIGRPLRALPSKVDSLSKICTLRRWNLVKRLSADLWQKWHTTYLQTMQKRQKWRTSQPNLQPGDVVLLKESETFKRSWPLARVVEVYPGADGLVRVVTIQCEGRLLKRAVKQLVPLIREERSLVSLPRECVQACK